MLMATMLINSNTACNRHKSCATKQTYSTRVCELVNLTRRFMLFWISRSMQISVIKREAIKCLCCPLACHRTQGSRCFQHWHMLDTWPAGLSITQYLMCKDINDHTLTTCVTYTGKCSQTQSCKWLAARNSKAMLMRWCDAS